MLLVAHTRGGSQATGEFLGDLGDFEITAAKTGTFTGHCSELVRPFYHSRIVVTVKVVTPQQFQAYTAAQQAAQSSSGSTQ